MPKRVYSGKMTSKGQVTIPQEVRQKYGLTEGDRLEFVLHEATPEYITVYPAKKKTIADVAGSLTSAVGRPDLESASINANERRIAEKFGTNADDGESRP